MRFRARLFLLLLLMGGLVGVFGFPELMDGATITATNLAFWDPEKGWAVENEGVPPDIEVEESPADVIAGRDLSSSGPSRSLWTS